MMEKVNRRFIKERMLFFIRWCEFCGYFCGFSTKNLELTIYDIVYSLINLLGIFDNGKSGRFTKE